MSIRSIIGLAAGIVALSSGAHASMVNISGDGAWGDFAGTLTYTHVAGNQGTLDVSLTNTSPVGNGGFITGFVYNIINGGAGRTASLSARPNANWQLVLNESANPFGTFDAGAALGGNWEGGGNPNNGIGVGDTGNFTFAITAPNAGSLTASSFVGASAPFQFIVRFRGFQNGQSDKVPVPTPGALALLGAGGLIASRRRR
jgi:MYXO-CTERM domain-containing protein